MNRITFRSLEFPASSLTIEDGKCILKDNGCLKRHVLNEKGFLLVHVNTGNDTNLSIRSDMFSNQQQQQQFIAVFQYIYMVNITLTGLCVYVSKSFVISAECCY